MGEKQLSLVPIYCFALFIFDLYDHVPQGKPLHSAAVFPLRGQRYQRGPGLYDGVAQHFRHSVAVPCRAGGRIGQAACGKYNCLTVIFTMLCLHGSHVPTSGQDTDRPLLRDLHPRPAQRQKKSVYHIGRAVGLRKYPVAPFCFQRDAQRLEKFHGIRRRKAGHSAGEEATVSGHVFQDLLYRAVVSQITSALAGDV